MERKIIFFYFLLLFQKYFIVNFCVKFYRSASDEMVDQNRSLPGMANLSIEYCLKSLEYEQTSVLISTCRTVEYYSIPGLRQVLVH